MSREKNTFCKLLTSTKDILYIVTVSEHSSIHFSNCRHSNGSDHPSLATYGTSEITHCDTGTMRWLLNTHPTFFDEFPTYDLEEHLKGFGFTQREPDRIEKLLYEDNCQLTR